MDSKFLKTIGFVSTIEHAESITALFVSNGIKAAAYHSKLSTKVREQLMQDFKDNKIEVMFSVSSLIAGFDMPDIQAGIMMRPTKRVRTYLQAVGRILRLSPGKEEAIWIDAAKITQDHGLYDNPYDFTIEDPFKLKEYKQKRSESYINAYVKKHHRDKMLTRVTESKLKTFKKAIEGDSSLEGLIARYDACNNITVLLGLGFKIAKQLGQPSSSKTLHFVMETCVPYVEEGGSLKAIKTRMRNIIKDGKKLASLHYFPKWLKEQNWN